MKKRNSIQILQQNINLLKKERGDQLMGKGKNGNQNRIRTKMKYLQNLIVFLIQIRQCIPDKVNFGQKLKDRTYINQFLYHLWRVLKVVKKVLNF